MSQAERDKAVYWTRHLTEIGRLREAYEMNKDNDRANILWFILDDLMHGRTSALVDAEVIVKALREKAPFPFVLNGGAGRDSLFATARYVFSKLDRADRTALLVMLEDMHRKLP